MTDRKKEGNRTRTVLRKVFVEPFFTWLTTVISLFIAFSPLLRGPLNDDPIHRAIIIFLGLVSGQIIDTNRKMRRSIEKASHLAELTAEEETSAELRESVESMIRAAAAIEQEPVRCFRGQAVQQVEDFADKMKELGNGVLVIPEHQFDPCVRDALREARNSIKATAMFDHKDGFTWWTGNDGMDYWYANLEFLAKHPPLGIERVFIYEGGKLEDDENADVHDLAELQAKAGVRVFTVSMEVLENASVAPFDFGIFDDTFAWERSTNGAGEPYQLKFMVNKAEVHKRVKSFDHIRHFAHEYTATGRMVISQPKQP